MIRQSLVLATVITISFSQSQYSHHSQVLATCFRIFGQCHCREVDITISPYHIYVLICIWLDKESVARKASRSLKCFFVLSSEKRKSQLMIFGNCEQRMLRWTVTVQRGDYYLHYNEILLTSQFVSFDFLPCRDIFMALWFWFCEKLPVSITYSQWKMENILKHFD